MQPGEVVVLVLSVAAPLGSLLTTWLLTERRRSGLVVGLLNQGVWVALALATGAYGLLVGCAVDAVLYGRGLRRWSR